MFQSCFVSATQRCIWKIVFIEVFEFYFTDRLINRWSRIILAINSSPSRIGLTFAIITINRPLSLLQMCLDVEYGILMEFWNSSHYSVTSPSALLPFPPKVVIEDPLISGMNNDSCFFHSNFEPEAVYQVDKLK